MRFRLTYRGKLPASGRHGRAEESHGIRRHFHKQLAQLWNWHPFLLEWTKYSSEPLREGLFNQHQRCGYRFVPLIGGRFEGACALDILFLRRDDPGNLIIDGGDIDNRVKTLFDGLKIPDDCTALRNNPPTQDEDPLFCLLRDDRLITEVKVTTDRLLTPLESDENVHDVHLVVHVKTVALGSAPIGAFLT